MRSEQTTGQIIATRPKHFNRGLQRQPYQVSTNRTPTQTSNRIKHTSPTSYNNRHRIKAGPHHTRLPTLISIDTLRPKGTATYPAQQHGPQSRCSSMDRTQLRDASTRTRLHQISSTAPLLLYGPGRSTLTCHASRRLPPSQLDRLPVPPLLYGPGSAPRRADLNTVMSTQQGGPTDPMVSLRPQHGHFRVA